MNVLFVDGEGLSLHLAMIAQRAGHRVRVWIPNSNSGERSDTGDGLIEKVPEWKPSMKWADLIIPTNCAYREDMEPFHNQGYPIFGANWAGGELELNRPHGLQTLKDHGLDVNSFTPFTSFDRAISFVKSEGKAFACKPLGDADKSLSYVAKSPADLVFKLERWKRKQQLKSGFLLQELVEGAEVAVGGWFGAAGFLPVVCESWEEKRLMNGGLGVNTGEQGTVVRYTVTSKLFAQVLDPLTEYLHHIKYRGYVDVNSIVNRRGQVVPLEWTCRLGWPLANIQSFLHEGDPVEWMRDALDGRDTLKVKSDVAVGVVMSHGDYPAKWLTEKENAGYPLYNVKPFTRGVALTEAKMGTAPMDVGETVENVRTLVSAGNYLLVGVGLGKTVKEAQKKVYELVWNIDLPSNRMFRTDIGDRLESDLPLLQRHGFCLGMET